MPQQLIYTSAPRGVVAGRSGHCTVARSAAMREALMLQLEKLSYYQHLSLSGGKERAIYSCRVVDIRSSRYHVLTRIQDAGLDFTGRTNFLAHHLVFTPEEIRQFPSPPVILRGWPGWLRSWSKDPQLLEKEDWSTLNKLSSSVSIPATTWEQVTGDAVNGYSLLESCTGIAFRVDNIPEEQMLALFAESLELLELRDPRRDFRATAWQYTFTTSMQEQDNPADFRWRCLHSDNPAANRFAGPDSRPLSEMRALRVTSEETIFARSGRQPPRFVIQPQDVRSTEGEPARLHAKAEGVPSPSYQWFAVDRIGNGQVVATGTDAELVVQNPPIGVSRYVVRASNSQGEVTSAAATLSVERKLRLSQTRPVSDASSPVNPAQPSYVKSADDIDRQRRRIEAEQAQVMFQRNLRRKKVFATCGVIIALIVGGGVFWWRSQQQSAKSNADLNSSTNTISSVEAPPTDQPGNETQIVPPTKPQLGGKGAVVAAPSSNPPGKSSDSLPSEGFGLPDGWTQVLVGAVTNYRAECIDIKPPLRFDLAAASTGFFTNADNLLFVCKTNAGKEFKATLLKLNSNSSQGRAGIMLRDSQKPDSAFLFIGASPQKIIVSHRDPKGSFLVREAEMPKGTQDLPLILKFDQKDGQFIACYSFDSSHWFPFPELTISVSPQTLFGFTLSSGSSSERVTARFVDVSPSKQP